MVNVYVSVILPCTIKVQRKISSGTGSPRCSQKKRAVKCVTWDPAPAQKRNTAAPNFRPVSCGQTAGWIKMSLGMEIGLCPGHVVLVGDPPTPLPPKGHTTEVDLGQNHIVLDGDPAPLKNWAQHPQFWAVSVVAIRSPISSTAELLL